MAAASSGLAGRMIAVVLAWAAGGTLLLTVDGAAVWAPLAAVILTIAASRTDIPTAAWKRMGGTDAWTAEGGAGLRIRGALVHVAIGAALLVALYLVNAWVMYGWVIWSSLITMILSIRLSWAYGALASAAAWCAAIAVLQAV